MTYYENSLYRGTLARGKHVRLLRTGTRHGRLGETAEQARRNLLEVVGIGFQDMRQRGTLAEYLREAGYPSGVGAADDIRLDKELVGFEPVAIAL